MPCSEPQQLRSAMYEAIVKGDNVPEPGIPESFKVMIHETRGLALDIEVVGRDGEQVELRDLDEDVFRSAEALGIDLTCPERGADGSDDPDTEVAALIGSQ